MDSRPTGPVELSIQANAEASVSPATLTFDASSSTDWSTPKTVTVTAVNDDVDDGDVSSTITVSVEGSTADSKYNLLTSKTVSVTTIDNDVAGFTIKPNGGISATEGGNNGIFTVELDSRPTGNVVLSIQANAEASVSPATLTFDASSSTDWSTPKTVTITAVDDDVDDGDVSSTITVLVGGSTADSKYKLLTSKTVSVTTIDNDTVGLVLSKDNATMSENGTVSDNFSVVLTSEPTATVTLTLSDNDSSEVYYTPTSLVFGSGNWSTPQWVSLTGKDDNTSDGLQSILLTVSSDNSSTLDDQYDGLSASLTATTSDNDTVGLVVSKDNATVDERSGTDNFTVRLQSQPTDNVTLVLTVSDDNESSVSPSSLMFSPDNWSIAQTVLVSGVVDRFVDGSQNSTITVASDNSTSDSKYDGLSDNLTVITLDNDTAVVTIEDGSVLESATTAKMKLRLTNAVTSGFEVIVKTTPGTATSNDFTAISSQTVTFEEGSDNETKEVVITLRNDGMVEDNETLTLSMTSVSNSAIVITDTGTLTIVDDDVATLTIDNVSFSESAGSAIVTLKLDKDFMPGSFTVDVSTSDGTATTGDADYTSVENETVTFVGNADETQTVSITLRNDNLVEGNETFTVSMSNPSYGVLDVSDTATVTIVDDDNATLTIDDNTVDEGDNVTLTLRLDNKIWPAVLVWWFPPLMAVRPRGRTIRHSPRQSLCWLCERDSDGEHCIDGG